MENILIVTGFFSLRFLTPLHVASEKAHNDVVEVVVKHEAKVYNTSFLVILANPASYFLFSGKLAPSTIHSVINGFFLLVYNSKQPRLGNKVLATQLYGPEFRSPEPVKQEVVVLLWLNGRQR